MCVDPYPGAPDRGIGVRWGGGSHFPTNSAQWVLPTVQAVEGYGSVGNKYAMKRYTSVSCSHARGARVIDVTDVEGLGRAEFFPSFGKPSNIGDERL